MNHMVSQYELFYVVGDSKEAELARIKEDVVKLIEEKGGTLAPEEAEEHRKLAYPIKHEIRGTYVTRRFTMPGVDERKKKDKEGMIAELSRQLELSKDVLRFILVRAEGLLPLGEREVVPQAIRRSRDGRQPAPVGRFETPMTSTVAVKPIVKEAPKTEVKTEVKAEVLPAPVETVRETPVVEKPVKAAAKTPAAKAKEESEETVATEEPKAKKPATKKKKETTLDEDEIDKKLDEVLNL